ncbi:MAG: histidine phosphatase family protein [Pseudomonadota bacterium]
MSMYLSSPFRQLFYGTLCLMSLSCSVLEPGGKSKHQAPARSMPNVTVTGILATQNSGPAEVIFIRHGEKPSVGDDLNDKGYQRAQLLVNYFKTSPDVTAFGAPVAIYAMARPHQNSGSLRAIETVTPLALSLGLTVNTSYLKDDYQAMIKDIMSHPEYSGKMVLICWEHAVIPEILDGFGYTGAPQEWPGSNYFDRTWVLDFADNRPSTFHDYNQHLFADDQ